MAGVILIYLNRKERDGEAMIELKSIQKIYKSGRRGECRALDGVSFDLPERL